MGLDSEEWRTIEGTNYEVSSRGRVRNAKTKRLVRQFSDSAGYKRVNVYVGKKEQQRYVHRLVACAFCDGYSDEMVVDHKDGDVGNNIPDNLRWVTQRENVWDSYKRGRQRRKPLAVLQVKNGKIIARYESVAEAFSKTGIRHISEVARGKRLTAGGFSWEYERT